MRRMSLCEIRAMKDGWVTALLDAKRAIAVADGRQAAGRLWLRHVDRAGGRDSPTDRLENCALMVIAAAKAETGGRT